MRTWFDPTTTISFDPTKARGGKFAQSRASKERVAMPLQLLAGVVMPLQLNVGVVMPPHLTRIGPRKWMRRRKLRLWLWMGTALGLVQEVVVEAVVVIRGRGVCRPTARRSESLPNEVGAPGGVRVLRLDQEPLDRQQLKILKTPGTVRISQRSGHAL